MNLSSVGRQEKEKDAVDATSETELLNDDKCII
jgi:hypothetical protein